MKKIIRKQIINLLKTLPQYKRDKHSLSCTEQIIALPEYQQAKCIALYLANAFELNLTTLIMQCWKDNKQVVVPQCDYTTYTMHFVPLNSLEDVIEDEKKILTSCHTTIVNTIDLMIVPGLAFTEEGYRIGYGGGFYDKYLAQYPQLFTVSLSILPQIIDFTPEHFDVPVKQIIKSKYI